jgi:hypothetical protein
MAVIDRMMGESDGRVIEESVMGDNYATREEVGDAVRVVAWIKSFADVHLDYPNKPIVQLIRGWYLYRDWIHAFEFLTDEHRDFCEGRMPGFVYADYLEEFVSDVDPRVLELLRKEVTECRTNPH